MATNVIMPKLGMTMTEGTIIKWHKKVGDAIEEGMPLFDVETDKLTNTVNANVSGTLLKISVPEDGTADCLAVVAVIGSEGEKLEAEPAPAAAAEPAAPQTESGNDLIVIGGGPGGYVAAIRGAQLGMKVTLIEADAVGGTCLNRGCMPTKALLHSAEVYELATHSAGIGIVANDVSVDWNAVQNARAGVTKKLTDGVKALIKANKITLISGKASFADPKTVSVGGRILTAGKIIIASGSAPIVPPIKGISECGAVIDSTACLQLDHVPESLLVIGGGVIGLELGSVYARFGSKVTVVEMSPKLLPLMDSELTAMVRRQLETKGMEILTESKVVSVESCGAGGRVHIECPNGERTVEAEKILLCVGRKPNIEGLGLEKAGVKTERGYIQVNDRMETYTPSATATGSLCWLMPQWLWARRRPRMQLAAARPSLRLTARPAHISVPSLPVLDIPRNSSRKRAWTTKSADLLPLQTAEALCPAMLTAWSRSLPVKNTARYSVYTSWRRARPSLSKRRHWPFDSKPRWMSLWIRYTAIRPCPRRCARRRLR